MNHEKPGVSHEQGKDRRDELAEVAAERRRELHEALEKKSPEQGVDEDKARQETERVIAEREADERSQSTHEQPVRSPEAQRKPDKRAEKAAFDKTMHEARSHMSPASRTFSKAIHNPVVEKVSDVTGKTVARPNALLAGGISAFVLMLGVYLIARHYGYPLSGAETMAAFALGYIIGLIFDYFKVLYTGGRSV